MPPKPLILGFDTSAAHCAAALLCEDGRIISRHEDMAKGQAERLIPLLEQVLADAGYDWADLDGLAVGIGPGNFTGIRISVSAARGLALGLGIPAIGVSNFEVLHQISACPDPHIAISLPAPRGASYLQRVHAGKPQGPAQLVAADATPTDIPAGTTIIGHDAQRLAALITDATAITAQIETPAETMVHIAATRITAPVAPPAPLYVKPPDAAPPRDTAPRVVG